MKKRPGMAHLKKVLHYLPKMAKNEILNTLF